MNANRINRISKIIMTSAIVLAGIGLSIPASVNAQNISRAQSTMAAQPAKSTIDISTGWKILAYTSDVQPDVNQIFIQGTDTTSGQRAALVQVGNMGDTTFTAQKTIAMKQGHKYDLDLIYAQFYSDPSDPTGHNDGNGYIDFNGDKIVADKSHADKHYKKTITPTADMNYTITVSFKTTYPGNAYFKIGYDKANGGVIDSRVANSLGTVTAKYVDDKGAKISDDVVKTGNVGDDYTTEQKDIDGYTFKEVQGKKSGAFTDQEQTVTYVYTKNNDTKPSKTVDPSKPVNPSKTVDPNENVKPSKSVNPGKTGDQSKSTDSSKAVDSSKATDSSDTANSQSSNNNALPQTGYNSLGTSILGVLGAALIGLVSFIIKKK